MNVTPTGARAALIASLLAAACGGAEPGGEPDDARADSASVPWHHEEVERDLTGDGEPEILRLSAEGDRIDSLTVRFQIEREGTLIFQEEWLTTWYFTYDPPLEELEDGAKATRVTSHFTDFFRPDAFGVLEGPPAGEAWTLPLVDGEDSRMLIAGQVKLDASRDSLTRSGLSAAEAHEIGLRSAYRPPWDTLGVDSIWADMRVASPPTFTFFSGGEHTRSIAWSPLKGRFYEVWSCC